MEREKWSSFLECLGEVDRPRVGLSFFDIKLVSLTARGLGELWCFPAGLGLGIGVLDGGGNHWGGCAAGVAPRGEKVETPGDDATLPRW